MKQNSLLRCKGFTLSEVLVAVVLLSIGIVSVLFNLSQGIIHLRENHGGLVAKAAIRRQIESLHNQPFAQVAALPPFSPFTIGLESLDNAQGMVWVEQDNGRADLLKVTVTVSIGAGRSFRIATLISRSP